MCVSDVGLRRKGCMNKSLQKQMFFFNILNSFLKEETVKECLNFFSSSVSANESGWSVKFWFAVSSVVAFCLSAGVCERVCAHQAAGRGGVKVMGDLHVMEWGLEGAGTGVACQHTTEGTCMVNQWDVGAEKEKHWEGYWKSRGGGGQACEEGGVRGAPSAWGRHWPQMLHRACSLQRRPQIILPHKSVATGPGRVDGGVEKMAKFHLLLIYTDDIIFFLAPLNRTTVNMNTRYNFGCSLSIFFFFCDEMLPPSDCLWGYEENIYFHHIYNRSPVHSREEAHKYKWAWWSQSEGLFFIPRHSLAWRRRRLLLLTQGALGGLKVAVATGSRFGGRFGASLWVLAVFYISHSLHIATTAHPSTGDLSPFGSPTTQGCPVPHWDLDKNKI